MYIEKISVQGFKSFKRKTSIPLLNGFTVFTGPNGSGKSCLAESISFVFGERGLRAKKAEQLIFHGSEKKDAADFARVSLHLNNSSKMLSIDEKEILITRRLNKNGTSSYKLNGKTINKQTLLDIFTQASIVPNGHNIIHQGDVTQIIEMNPIERRKIIDEISGISEYDDKKNKANKELEKVAEKLREAEIILNEKASIMERIKKDRDSAIKYKQYSDELEAVRASLIKDEYERFEKILKELNKKIEELEKKASKLDQDVKEADKILDDEEKKLEDITSSVMKASDKIEIMKKIERLRSDIERKEDRIESNKREIDRYREMISIRGVPTFLKDLKNFSGVHGILSELLVIPDKYRTAAIVAGGSHLNDIVVKDTDTAIKCINYLKTNKLGRARFLPMDKIFGRVKKELPKGALGWLSELIHHDPKYSKVIDYVFSSTACVNKIENAKEIFKRERIRMVTLDGDLIEKSGAITGGFYKSSSSDYSNKISKLNKENETLKIQIVKLKEELEKLIKEEEKLGSVNKEVKKIRFDERIKKIREKRKNAYEDRLNILQELNDKNIKRAKIEASLDNIRIQWEKYKEYKTEKKTRKELKSRQVELIKLIESLGPINMKAIEEYESLAGEFDDFKDKVEKIIEEKNSIEDSINKIEKRRRETFMLTMNKISENFKKLYSDLTKGKGELKLDNPQDINSGLVISASPEGKKLINLDAMSGGEKALTAIAFLFSIQRYKPSPFYVLDEIDAALDKHNTKKLADLVKKYSKDAQFILVSHNEELIKQADQVYGISMEDGESKIMGIKLPQSN